MNPVEIITIKGSLVLRARGSELLILPNHVAELKGINESQSFVSYFNGSALVNRPARKLFQAWLRKDQGLWRRIYKAVQDVEQKDLDEVLQEMGFTKSSEDSSSEEKKSASSEAESSSNAAEAVAAKKSSTKKSTKKAATKKTATKKSATKKPAKKAATKKTTKKAATKKTATKKAATKKPGKKTAKKKAK